MFGLFKKKEKSINLDELLKQDTENEKNAFYQLYLAYYRTVHFERAEKNQESRVEKRWGKR